MQADGDAESDIKQRMSKASQAFSMLQNVWKSKKLSRNTKIHIFKPNVLSVLLYSVRVSIMENNHNHQWYVTSVSE